MNLDRFIAEMQAEAICLGATDEEIYNQICNYWVYISPQPNAYRHLYHYRHNGGVDYIENVRSLFLLNPRISERIFSKIGNDLRQNPHLDSGSYIEYNVDRVENHPIRQFDYDSTDWLNSNGNINELHWRLEGDYNPYDNRETEDRAYYLRATRGLPSLTVQISIRDPYTWHPLQDRPSQCIHQAMERLKTSGAMDYITVGVADLLMPFVYLPSRI